MSKTIDIPECSYCHQPAVMATGDEVYSQRSDLEDKRFWVCWPCDARVGCHPGTNMALGTLANATLRRLRNQVHANFDVFWRGAPKQRGKARRAAYAQLANALGIPSSDCHVAYFNEERCVDALQVVASWLVVGSSHVSPESNRPKSFTGRASNA